MPAPTHLLGNVLFWLAAAIGAALVGVLALAVAGVVPVEGSRPTAPAAAPAPAVPAPAATRTASSRPAAPARPTPAPERVVVTVAATRGDSWISARLGSETGRVLEERLLPRGETARLVGPRVWLLVGASANVDVRVNGEVRTLAAGTVETVFEPGPTR